MLLEAHLQFDLQDWFELDIHNVKRNNMWHTRYMKNISPKLGFGTNYQGKTYSADTQMFHIQRTI